MANGKGSGRRPAAIPDAQVASEWERIFGPHQPKSDLARAADAFLRDNPEGGWFEYPLPLQRPAETISFAGPVIDAALRRMIADVARGPSEQ